MSQLLLLLLLTALSLSVTVNSSASAFAPGYTVSPPRPVKAPTSISAGHNRGIRPVATQQQRKSIAAVQLNMEAGTPALVYGAAAVATFGIQTGGFAVAYLLKTEKFYDVLGGVNYLLLALLSAVLGAAGEGALPWTDDPRKILATALFAASRSWLLCFLAWRAHERQGDARFDEVLGKGASAGHPPRPAGFFAYWMVQAFWVMLVSMPMLFINASRVAKPGFSALDYVWVLLFGTGVFTEIVADIQKAHWVKRGRQGDFCETGLWKYSRKLHDTPPPSPPPLQFRTLSLFLPRHRPSKLLWRNFPVVVPVRFQLRELGKFPRRLRRSSLVGRHRVAPLFRANSAQPSGHGHLQCRGEEFETILRQRRGTLCKIPQEHLRPDPICWLRMYSSVFETNHLLRFREVRVQASIWRVS